MIGVEFGREPGVAKRVQQACLGERLVLLTCGVNDQVVRWIPPLVVGEREIDAALAIFGRALAAAGATAAAPADTVGGQRQAAAATVAASAGRGERG